MRGEACRGGDYACVLGEGMNGEIGAIPCVSPKPLTTEDYLKSFKSNTGSDCILNPVAELTILRTIVQKSRLENVDQAVTSTDVLGRPSCWSFTPVNCTSKIDMAINTFANQIVHDGCTFFESCPLWVDR